MYKSTSTDITHTGTQNLRAHNNAPSNIPAYDVVKVICVGLFRLLLHQINFVKSHLNIVLGGR